ncbi:MAG: cupin domain-containing protein [Arenimonas sp.]
MIEVTASKKYLLGMPASEFLRDYWQKKPLLIRQAFPDYQAPLSPEDLAGIACEEGVLSRLVKHDRKKDHYSLETGPFKETMFPKLGKKDWTLLVQDMDKWDGDVRQLIKAFNFLPRWRVDDVMISFAAPGGSVGPHVDQYDVFLLQAQGQRRWEIDADPNADKCFREKTELKLLQHFTPSIAWTLAPGDMLYLPPGVPHHGEAVDACMTFSLGMRAPSHAELLNDWADGLFERVNEDIRYNDKDLVAAKDSGEIDAATCDRVLDIFKQHVPDSKAAAALFFGHFVTSYRNSIDIAPPPKTPKPEKVLEQLNKGAVLEPHPFARWAWCKDGREAMLFVQGERFSTTQTAASTLARAEGIDAESFLQIPASEHGLVFELIERGYLVLQK